GLGTQMDADTPELRAALLRRLDDPDGITRGEALVGLARRKDPRIVEPLREGLGRGVLEWAAPREDLGLEAVEELGDRSLVPDLDDLRDRCREQKPDLVARLDEVVEKLSRGT